MKKKEFSHFKERLGSRNHYILRIFPFQVSYNICHLRNHKILQNKDKENKCQPLN